MFTKKSIEYFFCNYIFYIVFLLRSAASNKATPLTTTKIKKIRIANQHRKFMAIFSF